MRIVPKLREVNYTLVDQEQDSEGRDLDTQAHDLETDGYDPENDTVTVDSRAVTDESRKRATVYITERQAKMLAYIKEDNTLQNIWNGAWDTVRRARRGDDPYFKRYHEHLDDQEEEQRGYQQYLKTNPGASINDYRQWRRRHGNKKRISKKNESKVYENAASDATKKSDFEYRSTPFSKKQVRKMDRTDYAEKQANIRKANSGAARRATAAGTTFNYHQPKTVRGKLNSTNIDKKEYRNDFYTTPTKDSFVREGKEVLTKKDIIKILTK
jgi:hypothetical protein